VRLVVALEFFILNPTDFFKSGSKFYKIMLNNLFASVVAGLLIGLITGLAELYLFQRFFKRLSFLVLFLAKLLLYLASIMIIGVLTLFFYYMFQYDIDVLEAFDKNNGSFRVGQLLPVAVIGYIFFHLFEFDPYSQR